MGVGLAIGATLLGGLGFLSAGSQVAGGFAQKREAERQARVAVEEGRVAREEAEERAVARGREVRKARSRQLVGFLKSGVTIAGTPEEVLTETELLGRQEVEAIQRSGEAQQRRAESQARALRFRGREAVFRGFSGAASSLIGSLGSAARLGGLGG